MVKYRCRLKGKFRCWCRGNQSLRSMKHTGKPVMKSALRAYESAAIAAHEIPPGGGTKAARCAAYVDQQI